MKYSILFGLLALVIFWVGCYTISVLDYGHWALFPTFITMSLGMFFSGIAVVYHSK